MGAVGAEVVARAVFRAVRAATGCEEMNSSMAASTSSASRMPYEARTPASKSSQTARPALTIWLRVNTQPGDEVILHEDAHPLHYEAGGAAHVGGLGVGGVVSGATVAKFHVVSSVIPAKGLSDGIA